MTIQARSTGWGRSTASMILALGAIATPMAVTSALAQVQTNEAQTLTATRLDSSQSATRDGVYVFGEAPVRDQIGSAYLVLEVQDDTVVGGVYMPHSSFDCFQGEVEGDRLNLNIVNSYDLSTYAYSVDLRSEGTVASTSPTAAPVELDGYHLLPTVTDNDLGILETCKADF